MEPSTSKFLTYELPWTYKSLFAIKLTFDVALFVDKFKMLNGENAGVIIGKPEILNPVKLSGS